MLLRSTALVLVSFSLATSALANGGAGGGVPAEGQSGGSGGVDNPIGVGGNGSSGSSSSYHFGGGGGGGAGETVGGAGGGGHSNGAFGSSSGSGGSGGVHGLVNTGLPVAAAAGTNGGAGGHGNGGMVNDGAGGGGGGAGGYGAVITGANVSGAIASTITGGHGGAGGNGAGRSVWPGQGGSGGSGGIGLLFTDDSQLKALTIDAAIQGGDGGAAGGGGGASHGAGGVGIYGGNLDITLGAGGAIAGGFAGGQTGNEAARGNAITFTGGSNRLAFDSAAPDIRGAIAIDGGTLTLDHSGNATLSNQITGIGALTKVGTNTLTLTGANTFSGVTTISAGTLQIGNGGTTGSITGNIVNNAGLAFNRSDASSYGGAITGSGTLTKAGAGALVLTGANNFGGGTTISGGTLQIGAGGTTGSIAGNIINNAALILQPQRRHDLWRRHHRQRRASPNPAQVRWSSLARTTLAAVPPSLTARCRSAAAARQAASPGTLPTMAGSPSFAATPSPMAAISPAPARYPNPARAPSPSPGTNTYAGGTFISGGTLQIGDGGTTGSIVGDITNNAGLAFNRSDSIVYGDAITGSGTLIKSGAGALTLTGANSHGGGTTISGGTLQIGNGGTTGSIAGNITNNAGLAFNRSDSIVYGGNISGTGALAKAGAGTLTLTGTNNYSGATTITGGTLAVHDGSLGSGAVSISAAATLAFDNSGTSTVAGAISGIGTLTKSGAGTLILTGNGTFAGTTTINGGTLSVNGALGNTAVTVNTGATLGGSGSIGGAVSILSGATLSAGNSPGTLNVGALTLNAGSTSVFELNGPGVAGGTGAGGNDLVNVTNDLTLGGTLKAQAGAAGYYRLFNYGGALAGGFATVDTAGSSFAVDQARIETFIPGQVNIAILGAGQTMQFWDGVDATGNGTVDGGTGIWNGTGTNWTGQPGQAGINTQWGGSVGIFGGTAGGTVTVQGTQAFDTLQFSTNGYLLTGGVLRFDPATGSAATVQVDNSISATIASELIDGTSATALTKTGAGRLILTGANTYTGGTTISGGTLQIGDGGTTGSIAGDIVNNATLVFNRSNSILYGESLTGSGALVKSGAGSLTLTGSATHSGGTTVSDGTLVIGSGGTNGSISGNIVNNADILINRSGMFSYAGAMTGTGALTLMGSGDTIFTGHSAIDGATVVRRGTLMIADGGTFSNYRGNIDNFYSDSAAALVTGAGSTWTNTFGLEIGRGDQGALTISNGGTVTVGDTASIGVSNGSNGAVLVNGTGSSWRVDNLLYVGENGTGALTISGGGAVSTASTVLGNAASASGTVTVTGAGSAWTNSGVLTVGNQGAGTLNIGAAAGELANIAGTVSASSINLANGINSRINFNHVGNGYVFASPITGTGSVHQLSGTTIFTGTNSYTGGTTITGGTLQIGNGGTTGTLTGNVTNNGTLAFNRTDAATFGGALSGTGALHQYGSARLTLTGDSAGFAGATTVHVGTLRVDGALGGSLAIGNGASLEGAGHVGAVDISGSGTLVGRAGDTLGIDSLVLGSDANVVVQLGTPSANALFDVTGDLVLDGTLNISDAGGFGAGVYRLFDYGGTLTDNGLALGALPSGIAADDLVIQTAAPGRVNLVSSAGADLLFWDGTNTALHDNGVVDGGAGIWTATGRMWTGAEGAVNGAIRPNPGFAVFQGNGGAVTLDDSAGALSVTGMQFASDGYSLVGDALALAGSGGRTVIRVGDASAAGAGITTTIGSVLTGAGDLVKADRGTLILTGANSYSGNTFVEGGTLIGNTTAIRGNIANAGTVIFDQAGDARFAGSIAGSGGVDGTMIKRGAGSLTLTGTSSLDWSIKEGSLVTSTQAFTGDAAIAAGATLVFNQADAGSYAGSLSGAGTLAIDGGHRLELTGNNAAFTGLFDVRGGRLIANGALGGTTRIGEGGFIGGNGTLGHMVVGAGGIASPGNSIGTLTVNGDITFEAGSTYAVEVDAAGDASDRITATGRAILNGGTVTHIGFDGNYRRDVAYTILTADGGVTGQFAGASSDYAFLDALLGYSANAVTLTLRRNDIDFATIGRNGNQRSVANAVQALDSGNPLFDAVVMLGADQARTAFDSLSGEVHASLQSVLVEDSRFIRSAALDRMRLAGAAADGDRGVAWWMQGIGNRGRLDGNGNAHRIRHDAAGVLMGVDAIAAEKLQFGLYGGWQKGDVAVRAVSSEAEVDSYHLGLYAGADTGRFSILTGFAFGWHDADTTRRISFTGLSETARASRRASTAQGFAEIGYRFDLAGTAIEPFANIAHVSLDSEATRERGDTAALRLAHMSMNTSFTTLGARLGQSFSLGGMQADLRAVAGWRHAFGDRTPEARLAFTNSDFFKVGGTPVAKNALSADIGLSLALSKRARVDIAYAGDVAASTQNHSTKATFSLAF
ncbi:outer membrane transport barrel [Sphingomonas sp. KC8]|nr:outer membrane transport barrel [Sphingomonas sp. KC8]